MRDLPAPLPPERRTVGQLIAESIRTYGSIFWQALPFGLPLAIADQLSIHQTAAEQALVFWVLTPLFVAAYISACVIVLGGRATKTAIVVAVLLWIPFPVLRAFFIVPGLVWFALFGLAVPAAMLEHTGFRESLLRGRRLAQVDFVHILGALCALVLVVGVSANVLSSLLHTAGESGQRVAIFLSDVVLSPLLFVGSAMLYLDQSARLRSRADAGLHPPLDVDAAGSPNAQVES